MKHWTDGFLQQVLCVIPESGYHWRILQYGCRACALMQLPPLLYWTLSMGSSFEVPGMAISAVFGLLAHLLIVVWNVCNEIMIMRIKYMPRRKTGLALCRRSGRPENSWP